MVNKLKGITKFVFVSFLSFLLMFGALIANIDSFAATVLDLPTPVSSNDYENFSNQDNEWLAEYGVHIPFEMNGYDLESYFNGLKADIDGENLPDNGVRKRTNKGYIYLDSKVVVAGNVIRLYKDGYNDLKIKINVVNDDKTIDFEVLSDEQQTLSVTYNGNGNDSGEVPVDNGEYVANDEVIIKGKGNLAKEGYTFKGWTIGENGETLYSEASTFSIVENTTLYAKWEEDVNGENTLPVPVSNNGFENFSNQDNEWLAEYGVHIPFEMNGYDLESYFNGLKADIDGENLPDNGVRKRTNKGYIYLDSKVAVAGNVIRLYKDGYNDLKIKINVVNDDKTIDFEVLSDEQQTLSVTYNGNGNDSGEVPVDNGEYVANDEVTIKGKGDLAKEGYTFKGWTIGENGETLYSEGSTFSIVENTTLYAKWEENPNVGDIEFEGSYSNFNYHIEFNSLDFVNNVNQVMVNSNEYTKVDSIQYGANQYSVTDNNINFSILEKDDIISIKSEGYDLLKLKVLEASDINRVLLLEKIDSNYELPKLNVRLVGYFDSAIVGQEDYDAISAATGSTTTNNNSNVEVQIALGDEPVEEDWKVLKMGNDYDVDIVSEESSANISEESGMQAKFSTVSGALTLAGIPAKAGEYPVNVNIKDDKGRTAESNAIIFKVYEGNEKLIDQLKIENANQMQDGKYIWDMEPWRITEFGGSNETVVVPSEIKAIFGSHTSGTYGILGYSSETRTQTLVLESGTDLTLVNMELLGSVNVVVKDGAKLSLHDSTVYGNITVENGGKLSVNYDNFNKTFLTGASIQGQIILNDGATLENAMIYSNANHLADGDQARQVMTPVVKASGNINIIGDVYIKGDDSPFSDPEFRGQPALELNNGTINVPVGSHLATFGGGLYVDNSNGGPAVTLNNGVITGDGKFIAVGGNGFFEGRGGAGVEGTGIISTKESFIKGGDKFTNGGQNAGVSVEETVLVASPKVKRIEGIKKLVEDDSDYKYQWRDITKTPNLPVYELTDEDVQSFVKVRTTDKTYYRDGAWGNKVGTTYRNTVKTTYGTIKDSNGIEWYRVIHNNKVAYIYSLYTSLDLTPLNDFYVRATDKIDVRTSVWGSKVGVIEKNTIKTVYGIKKDRDGNTWYRIWFNGKAHYILSNNTSTTLTYNVRTTDKIFLRENPWGTKKGQLYRNTIKTVYGTKTDNNGVKWYKVWRDGSFSYIYSLYTSLDLEKVYDFNVTINKSVDVRTDVWGSKVGVIGKNAVKTVYGIKKDRDGNTWYRIWFNGKARYIRSNNTSKR